MSERTSTVLKGAFAAEKSLLPDTCNTYTIEQETNCKSVYVHACVLGVLCFVKHLTVISSYFIMEEKDLCCQFTSKVRMILWDQCAILLSKTVHLHIPCKAYCSPHSPK